jgi:hypothetical protein
LHWRDGAVPLAATAGAGGVPLVKVVVVLVPVVCVVEVCGTPATSGKAEVVEAGLFPAAAAFRLMQAFIASMPACLPPPLGTVTSNRH